MERRPAAKTGGPQPAGRGAGVPVKKGEQSMVDTRPEWEAVDAFLAAEGLSVTTAQLLADPARQRLSALCLIEHDGRVLMLQRLKEPFAGYWTAPGGKLLPGENPREAVLREVREETGLLLTTPELRLIASETGPENYNWLLFFFRASPQAGSSPASYLQGPRPSREGRLDWLPADRLAEEKIPNVERRLLPYVRAAGGPPYFARVHFASDKEIAELDVRPLERRR